MQRFRVNVFSARRYNSSPPALPCPAPGFKWHATLDLSSAACSLQTLGWSDNSGPGQHGTVMIEMAFIVGSLSSLQPTDGRPLPSAGNDWPIRQTPCIVEMHDLWSCMRQRRKTWGSLLRHAPTAEFLDRLQNPGSSGWGICIPWEKQVGCVICCLNPWRQAVTPRLQ